MRTLITIGGATLGFGVASSVVGSIYDWKPGIWLWARDTNQIELTLALTIFASIVLGYIFWRIACEIENWASKGKKRSGK